MPRQNLSNLKITLVLVFEETPQITLLFYFFEFWTVNEDKGVWKETGISLLLLSLNLKNMI